MKNKMKEWRRRAKAINAEHGSKHNGRRFKLHEHQDKPEAYPLLESLLKRLTKETTNA